MAYMSQENKKSIAAKLKPVLKKYGVKGSLSVSSGKHSLNLTVRSGNLQPFADCPGRGARGSMEFSSGALNVNTYHYERHFEGETREFLREAIAVMNAGNHDHSDIMTDYFNVGWYIDIDFGKWDKAHAWVPHPA